MTIYNRWQCNHETWKADSLVINFSRPYSGLVMQEEGVWHLNTQPLSMTEVKQGKSEGFDGCDQPRNLTWNWIQIINFSAHVTLKFDGWPWKTIGHLCYTTSSFVQHFKAISEFKLELQSGNSQFRSKLVIFLSCVILKFAGWPLKTAGHLFYSTSGFMHHFKAISEFKLEVQSGNAQFGSKSSIFCPVCPWIWQMTLKNKRTPLLCYFKLCASFHSHLWIQTGVIVRKHFFSRVTLKFVRWPWTRQIWGIWKQRPAYSPETLNLGQNRWCFVPCDLEIWWMTLENNRASLLCCFKLCATFHSHWWTQTGVTVRKRPIWVKFDDF